MDEVKKRELPHGGKVSSKKIAGLVILAGILCVIYIHNLRVDARRKIELDTFMQQHGHRGIHPENQEYIDTLKVNRTSKTNAAVLLGFVRGAIIGTMLGGDSGFLEGMVSFGVLNGVLYWVSEHLAEIV